MDLNAPDSRGLRPIHLAAMRGMSETVAALLDAGVPPDAMGAEGNTALHLASWHMEEGAVAVLVRAGETFFRVGGLQAGAERKAGWLPEAVSFALYPLGPSLLESFTTTLLYSEGQTSSLVFFFMLCAACRALLFQVRAPPRRT